MSPYDRLASGPVDYDVLFDNMRVGQIQGQALLKALVWSDPEEGSDRDDQRRSDGPERRPVQEGRPLGARRQGRTIGKEYDTPDWTPDKAQTEAQAAITALGKDKIIGFYSANDGMAGGISAAIEQAGFLQVPPLTGQDAELAAIQRIVAGDQTMTVYKAIKPEAEAAAAMAFALVKGEHKGISTRRTAWPPAPPM